MIRRSNVLFLTFLFLLVFVNPAFSDSNAAYPGNPVVSLHSPAEGPEEVIKGYYQNVKDGDFEAAYEKLSEATRKNCSKKDFILFQKLLRERIELKDFEARETNELKDFVISGIKYQQVVEFKVTDIYKDYYNEGKENTRYYTRKVVNDNGLWKLHREGDINEHIAVSYCEIGYMYEKGIGKEKNLIQAANNYNEAIKKCPEYTFSYLYLGTAYLRLQRYDDSIEKLNIFIDKSEDKNLKSQAYTYLGGNYYSKGQYQKATEALEKALEVNPDNDFAEYLLFMLRESLKNDQYSWG